jgi:hypothetical protein
MSHRLACLGTNWALTFSAVHVYIYYSGTGKLATERSRLSEKGKILAFSPKAFDYLDVWLDDFFGLNRRAAIGAELHDGDMKLLLEDF